MTMKVSEYLLQSMGSSNWGPDGIVSTRAETVRAAWALFVHFYDIRINKKLYSALMPSDLAMLDAVQYAQSTGN